MEDHNSVTAPNVEYNSRKRKPYKNSTLYNFNCECGKNFTLKKHYNAHKRKCDISNEPSSSVNVLLKNPKKKCVLCDYITQLRKEIINHYEYIHDIRNVEEKLTFESQNQFLLWKNKIESDTKAKFVNKGVHTFSKHKITYFNCHRSGYYCSRGKGIRSLKSQGTVKINGFCPSRIMLKCFNDGTCNVHFSSTHIGHQNELKHLTLTSADREDLAKKISLKIPFDDILDEVRNSIYNCDIQRKHLLTRKDLHNIEEAHNLQSKAMKHDEDAISVDAWVREMENQDDTGEHMDSLVINEGNAPENCEVAIEELGEANSFCRDITTRREKLKAAYLEVLDSISNIEEIEIMEKMITQTGPMLAAIKDKSLPSFERKQDFVSNKNIVPQEKFYSSIKKRSIKPEIVTDSNENAFKLLNMKNK